MFVASLNIRRVFTSMPLTAETTTTAVSTAERASSAAPMKSGVAGGVEDVQVLAVVVGVEDVGVDGEVVLVFLVVGVGDRGAVVHAAQPIDRVGLEEQGIGQAGLARGAVPDECNVPDVLHQVLDGHERPPLGKDVRQVVRRAASRAGDAASGSRIASRRQSLRTDRALPSYSARPMMQPNVPAAVSRCTCSRVQTPPDAMTGSGTAACISARASKFGPLIMPSVAMSVYTTAASGASLTCFARSTAFIRETVSQPSVATNPSFASTPRTIRSGCRSAAARTQAGSCSARVPRTAQRTPQSNTAARSVVGADAAAELARARPRPRRSCG